MLGYIILNAFAGEKENLLKLSFSITLDQIHPALEQTTYKCPTPEQTILSVVSSSFLPITEDIKAHRILERWTIFLKAVSLPPLFKHI